MRKHSGASATLPIALVHAGARPYQDAPELLAARNAALRDALRTVWPQILEGLPAVDAVTALVACLEEAPSCNAGRGAALQRDGLARLSASLMSGARQKFSGVVLATHLVHPSWLARALQDREEAVRPWPPRRAAPRARAWPPSGEPRAPRGRRGVTPLPRTGGRQCRAWRDGGGRGARRERGDRGGHLHGRQGDERARLGLRLGDGGGHVRLGVCRRELHGDRGGATGSPSGSRRGCATGWASSRPRRRRCGGPWPQSGSTAGSGSTAAGPGPCTRRWAWRAP